MTKKALEGHNAVRVAGLLLRLVVPCAPCVTLGTLNPAHGYVAVMRVLFDADGSLPFGHGREER
jgi:hypothetical protein